MQNLHISPRTARLWLLAMAFLLTVGGSISAQPVIVSKTVPHGTEFSIQNLDLLNPFTGNNPPAPRYDFTWITNDGQFYFTGSIDSLTHGYDLNSITSGNAEVRVYATAIYSDHGGQEPPKRVIPGGPAATPLGVPAQKTNVLDTAVIRLQKNSLNLVKGDTTLFILSFKNPLSDTFATAPAALSGQVLFFYDGRLQVLGKDGASSKLSKEPVADLYTRVIPQEQFNYFPSLRAAFDAPVAVANPALKDFFKNMLVYEVDDLLPGEEHRLFFQMYNEELHLESIPSGGLGGTRFLAVFLVDPPQQGNINLPPFSALENSVIDELKLSSLFGELLNGRIDGVPRELLLGRQIAGLSEVYSTLSRSHDPNEINLEACECPPNSGGAQKIAVRVDFENEGTAPTTSVKVNIAFPAEYDVRTVPDQFLDLFPSSPALQAAMQIERNTANNELIVTFPGLRLEGKTDGFDNYLDRVGHFSFTILTQPGTALASLPAVEACITFSDTVGENDLFCTVPQRPRLVGSQEMAGSLAALALNCDECRGACTSIGICCWLAVPFWLCILLLILALIIFIVIIYRAFFNN